MVQWWNAGGKPILLLGRVFFYQLWQRRLPLLLPRLPGCRAKSTHRAMSRDVLCAWMASHCSVKSTSVQARENLLVYCVVVESRSGSGQLICWGKEGGVCWECLQPCWSQSCWKEREKRTFSWQFLSREVGWGLHEMKTSGGGEKDSYLTASRRTREHLREMRWWS